MFSNKSELKQKKNFFYEWMLNYALLVTSLVVVFGFLAVVAWLVCCQSSLSTNNEAADSTTVARQPPTLTPTPTSSWCLATQYRLRNPLTGALSESATAPSSASLTFPSFAIAADVQGVQVQRQVTGSSSWTTIYPEFVEAPGAELVFVDKANPCTQPWLPTKPEIAPRPDPQPFERDPRGFTWRSFGGSIWWCLATRYRYRYATSAGTGPWSDWSGIWQASTTERYLFPMFWLQRSVAPRTDFQPSLFLVDTAARAILRVRTYFITDTFLTREVRLPRTGTWSADSCAEALTAAFAADGWASSQTIVARFNQEANDGIGRFQLHASGPGLVWAQVLTPVTAALGDLLGFPDGQQSNANTWMTAVNEVRFGISYVREATLPVSTDNLNQGCP